MNIQHVFFPLILSLVNPVTATQSGIIENAQNRCDVYAFIVWESEGTFLATIDNPNAINAEPNASNAAHFYLHMHTLHQWYITVHGYLSLIICSFGIGANVLTVFVFTQPGMLSPINCLLIGIAFCDGFVMATYLVYTFHFHLLTWDECDPGRYTHGWTAFTWFHANSALVLHGSSLWIACSLALMRVLMLRQASDGVPSAAGTYRLSNQKSVLTMSAILALTSVAFIPNYMTLKLRKIDMESCDAWDSSVDAYNLEHDRGSPAACQLLQLAFWVNSVLFKIFPAILLSILVCLLVRVMREASRRRRVLRRAVFISAVVSIVRRSKSEAQRKEAIAAAKADNTSRMLLTLLAIMLTTEVPQGVLTLLSGVSSDGFRVHFYENIADLLDLLSLLNCAINFPLYCVMSEKFRAHCVRLLEAPLKKILALRRRSADRL